MFHHTIRGLTAAALIALPICVLGCSKAEEPKKEETAAAPTPTDATARPASFVGEKEASKDPAPAKTEDSESATKKTAATDTSPGNRPKQGESQFEKTSGTQRQFDIKALTATRADQIPAQGDATDDGHGHDHGVADGRRTELDALTSRAQPAVDVVTGFIKAEPAELDLGLIDANTKKRGVIKLTNNGEESFVLEKCRTSCGCTSTVCPEGQAISPGESVEVEVEMKAGSRPGQKLNKNVTFKFVGHGEVKVPVKGEVFTYLVLEPDQIDTDAHPEGKVTVKSTDGELFRIVSMSPPYIESFPDELKAEHVIHLPYERFIEDLNNKFTLAVDHPKSTSVVGTLRKGEVVNKITEGKREKYKTRNTPEIRSLATAARRGEVEAMSKLLAEEGVDVNKPDVSNQTPLRIAAEKGHVDIIEMLVAAGADVDLESDTGGMTPLMTAARAGHAKAINALIEAGADIEARSTSGGTALYWASILGKVDAVRTLVEAGADVNTRDNIGFVPLFLAIMSEPTGESARVLVEAGADIESRCAMFQDKTPLLYACEAGDINVIKVLVGSGANIEAVDMNGRNAVALAVQSSKANADIVKMLLDAGADPKITDKDGKSAVDYAQAKGNEDILKVLTGQS